MEEEIVIPQRMPHEDGLSIPRVIFELPTEEVLEVTATEIQQDEEEVRSTDDEIQTD
jgi:hypothetical protein